MMKELALLAVGTASLGALALSTQALSAQGRPLTFNLLGGSIKVTNKNTDLAMRRDGENYYFENGNNACFVSVQKRNKKLSISKGDIDSLVQVTKKEEERDEDKRLFHIKSVIVSDRDLFGAYSYQYTIPTPSGHTVPNVEELKGGAKVMVVMMGHGFVEFKGLQYKFDKGCAIISGSPGGTAEDYFNNIRMDFFDIDKRLP